MNDELFAELLDSVREAKAIMRGEMAPSRVTGMHLPDAKQIREELGLSQDQFAQRLGVQVATLRNWEQGRRKPTGPARVLLSIVQQRPDVLTPTAPTPTAPTPTALTPITSAPKPHRAAPRKRQTQPA